MVFTLQRYIFRELLKVFILTALALTVMLSLGSILRPVQEYGIGPRQVLYIMGYFLPVTLTFVLPIAALFASSLVYGRLAGDNELDACRASGISLMTLIYPGLNLAIAVAIANLLLSFHVMPIFIHRAEKSIKADAKHILFRNIQRKGYYKLPPDGRYLLYADVADATNNILSGVVVVGLEGGQIQKIITARSAGVRFNPHKRFNEVRITAVDTYRMSSDGASAFAGKLSFATEFGSLLGDDIKFKKLNEMKKIRDVDPMLFNPVAKLARRAYAQLTAEMLAIDIKKKMEGDARSRYRLHSGSRIIEFTADNCYVKGSNKIKLSGGIRANLYSAPDKKLLRIIECQQAALRFEGDELSPTLTMEFENPAWKTPQGSKRFAYRPYVRGLILPGAVTKQFKTSNILKALHLAFDAGTLESPSARLKSLYDRLKREIRSTFAEIKAEIHSRLVFGVGCVVMILIGIAMGIIFKGGHLLSAFGISCVPAAVLMVCILMGKNISKNAGAQAISGIALMWAGFVILLVLTVGLYYRLMKN